MPPCDNFAGNVGAGGCMSEAGRVPDGVDVTRPRPARLIEADLREPDALLSHPVLTEMIDFSQPVGLLMTAVMHFVSDGSDPKGLIARYVRALAPGSYLALSQGTSDNLPPR